ncbi:MAG TPA: DUF5995 family protein [Blastococcus sp.]
MDDAVAALVARMESLLAPLEEGRDPARFFLGTYLRTTRAVATALAAGRFEDPSWVAAWDVEFACFYLDALELHGKAPEAVPAPWRLALGADPGLPPEAHVLLGMNAHINYDLPQSLVAVIPPGDFASPFLLDRRRRDHERIDDVLASRVGEEDLALQRAGGRRTPLDRLMTPVNRQASRLFLREARKKVWLNTRALHAARLEGDGAYVVRLADLEAVSADRVADLLRPGPVLVRLALHGFGVTLE